MPNFDDPIIEEPRRGPGAAARSKLKRRASKQAKRSRGMASKKRGGIGRGHVGAQRGGERRKRY